jgi:hypothetical protein
LSADLAAPVVRSCRIRNAPAVTGSTESGVPCLLGFSRPYWLFVPLATARNPSIPLHTVGQLSATRSRIEEFRNVALRHGAVLAVLELDCEARRRRTASSDATLPFPKRSQQPTLAAIANALSPAEAVSRLRSRQTSGSRRSRRSASCP